ncbi:tetraacyldisaccharide 4'-kinase [Arachidicoccus sp.]|uniref:tetraacyldisaccharide 4'-kinase n=1 Tax=Arachidicoccus sp. TaxID=1872624 RepID=UPI003D1C829C
MNFKTFFLTFFRFLLFPISVLYGCIIHFRNFLFDRKILRSKCFNFPIICIGNLSVGGTGKTPMAEYLLLLLQDKFTIATLSRGYKRKTKGYLLANKNTTSDEIGDEPMQFHQKFPEVAVAVGEDRINAIEQLMKEVPSTEALILDDAFQHRKVEAGLNILLTDYQHLFTKDYFLPIGQLRDQRSSYKRAQIIIVTKCPADLSISEKKKIESSIHLQKGQSLFFTSIAYGIPYHIFDKKELPLGVGQQILLIHGIARPQILQKYISLFDNNFKEIIFPDHHDFSPSDIKKVTEKFLSMPSENKIMITTEKDAVKLLAFKNKFHPLSLYILPIRNNFLFDQENEFNSIVENFISQYK